MNARRPRAAALERIPPAGRVARRVLGAALLLAGCSLETRGTGAPVGVRPWSDARVPGLDAGISGAIDGVSQGDDVPDAARCDRLELGLAPHAPSLFILIDRSSSMFEQELWDPLRAGVLEVVARLEHDIRFGFATYTGAQGGSCPELTPIVASARDRGTVIRDAYAALDEPPYKGETPTALALAQVADLLAADPDAGAKFILLVTDGEPDLCDDDDDLGCARDAVVAALQRAYARDIGGFVFGVAGQIERTHLQDMANAGDGRPVAAPEPDALEDCPPARARYAARGGTAPFYESDLTDPRILIDSLSQLIASLRSCVFDLEGGWLAADALARGSLELDGRALQGGEPDGFRITGARELELLGASCARLRTPDARLRLTLPCDATPAP